MDFDCWNWKATQDTTPGPTDFGTLTISATCGQFDTDGNTLALRQRRGGTNPLEPHFDLDVSPPDEAPAILSDEPVNHVMEVRREDKYTRVTIWFDGEQRWEVPVEIVSQS